MRAPHGVYVLLGDDELLVDVEELSLSVPNPLTDLQQGMAALADKAFRLRTVSSHDAELIVKLHHRGLDFMAITPQVSTFLMGIDAAMQEQDANRDDFDGSTIAAIKTSLMGPLAGIGDSMIPGTLRIIATGIAIGFCQQGSWLGPLLFLLVFNVPGFLLRYFGLKWGYENGASFITDAEKSGVMQRVTYVASIVGLAAIGAMTASYVSIDIPLVVGSGDFAKPFMDYLNDIMPCLPQLGLFGLMYWLLGKKRLSATWILLLIIVVSIAVCAVFGL